MVEILVFAAGLLLIAAVTVDVLHTTIHVAGSGFMTRRFAHLLWRLLSHAKPTLVLAGPAITILTVVLWFGLFWLGWCLVFGAEHGAVQAGTSGRPADLFSVIYFTGFNIITLGVGDYVPSSPLWQVLTVMAAASGFFIVTLVITYLLPLVSAVVEQRQLAAYIHSLGSSPRGILELGWNGKDYRDLSTHLNSLTPLLHKQTYLHLAYPILHYFRSSHRRSAVAPAVAALDDTLTLLMHSVPKPQRPADSDLLPLRCAVSELLNTLQDARIIVATDEPPAPGEFPLPESVRERRRLLAGWLRDQGWTWRRDVDHSPSASQ